MNNLSPEPHSPTRLKLPVTLNTLADTLCHSHILNIYRMCRDRFGSVIGTRHYSRRTQEAFVQYMA